MFAASKTAKAASAAAPTDPQFNYVTMLLHGDGTNGAQNNTFLDSSTNNFTITRNGNTTQGTFSPYGSNWSNNFNGSTGYLTVPSSSLFKPASSDFTIEAWVFVANTGVQQQVYGDCDSGTNNGICLLAISSALKVEVDYFTSSTAVVTKLTTGTVQANTWNHICVSKTGTTMYIGYNGTLETFTGIPSTMQSPSTIYPTIARLGAYNGLYVNGYISNFRYVIGSAVYTGSTYTVPTTPLTAISGTSILTCQSNRFIDNSTNALTITVNGSPSVQRFSPFNATSAYSTSVIGGSGYFDGTGDYLSLADNAALQWSTGDFCVEAWIYPSSVSGSKAIVCKGTNNTGTFDLGLYGAKIELYTNALVFSSSASLSANTWTHVAVTRSGTTLRCFINGALDTTVTSSYNFNNAGTFYVGVYGSASVNYFNGYMSDVRCVKGSAVYTSAFTPPTAPLTSITNTSLLNNFTNAAILDNAMMNDLETVGNAQISTSVKKYGTGSMYFDGSGDWVSCPASPQWLMAGDWTIECWIYPNSVTGVQVLVETRNRTTNASPCMYLNGTNLVIDTGSTAVVSAGTITISTWQYVAATRSGNSWRIFINGTQVGSTTTNTTSYTTAYGCCIGSSYYNEHYNGYIDDLRITRGYARYTSSFTPPTQAFPNN